MSDIEKLVIIVLSILNVVQIIYWPIQVHRLVDKLMSRNFAEYVQVKNLNKQPDSPAGDEESKLEEIAEERDILNQLNGMIIS